MLTFKFGSMGSGKTLELIGRHLSLVGKGRASAVIKPVVDTRYGHDVIRSRSGLTLKAFKILEENEKLTLSFFVNAGLITKAEGFPLTVFVDEAQFLSELNVESLRELADHPGVEVIAYGIRSDFRRRTFTGSKRLFELADRLEGIDTPCSFCNNLASFNMRVTMFSEDQIMLGDDSYKEVCSQCYAGEMGSYYGT